MIKDNKITFCIEKYFCPNTIPSRPSGNKRATNKFLKSYLTTTSLLFTIPPLLIMLIL